MSVLKPFCWDAGARRGAVVSARRFSGRSYRTGTAAEVINSPEIAYWTVALKEWFCNACLPRAWPVAVTTLYGRVGEFLEA